MTDRRLKNNGGINLLERGRNAQGGDGPYRMLFETAAEAIIVLMEGRIQEANACAFGLFARSREEFIGHSLADFAPREQPDGRTSAEFIAEKKAAVRRGGSQIFGWRAKRGEGLEFEVELQLREVDWGGRKAFHAIARESPEPPAASERLARESRFTDAVINSLPGVFYLFDDQGRFLRWNRNLELLTGYSHAEIAAMHPIEFFSGDDCALVAARIMEVFTTGVSSVEASLVGKDGSRRPFFFTGHRLIAEGRPYLVGMGIDLTERRRAEEAVRESDERFRQLAEQFHQAQKMEAIGQLSGGVAHEFNNILTAIMGHTALIRMSGNLTAENAENLREISRAAERASDLTRQLLTFSRKQVMALQDLDLNEVLRKLAKMFEPIVGGNIRLKLNHAAQPLWLQADRGMMEQIVLNLVVNARDAMPNGGRLELTTAPVDFRADIPAAPSGARAGAFVRLSVRDSGEGISVENRDRIFEPFFTTKDVGTGTGLGLSTVYGIVQQHHGWISMESELGQGTCFHIFLPRLEGRRAPAPSSPSSSRDTPSGGETILVVEDEPMVSFIVRFVLAEKGYRILTAAHGVEALEIWAKQRDEIDLLLTDIVMPDGISGWELAARVRLDHPTLPVLFTSGYDPQTAGESMPSGDGTAFLAKPFAVDALCQAVQEILHPVRAG